MFFLWISWMGVIYCFFFLDKSSPYRGFILGSLFTAIILSPYEITFGVAPVNCGGLCLTLLAVYTLRGLAFRSLASFAIRALVLSFAYGSINLLFFLDPVWIIWDRTWMLGILAAYLTILLFSNWKKRLSSLILGLFFGDIILNVLYGSLHMPQQFVSEPWLDLTALSGVFIVIWSWMEKASKSLHAIFQSKNIPKEKQG
ncbi:YphA family membrane protein [Peribacillus deserti]